MASADVIKLLLAPTPDRRLVLRDAKLERWKLLELVLSTSPPKLHIAVTITAVRYIVTSANRRYVSGNTELRHELTLEWTLLLRTSTNPLWRLIHTTSPATSLRNLNT